jgi:hypothetical protein
MIAMGAAGNNDVRACKSVRKRKKAGRRVSDGGKPRGGMTTVTVFVQRRMGMPRKGAAGETGAQANDERER